MTILSRLGHDAVAVRDVMVGADDHTIADYALKEDRMIVTLDLDFGTIYYFSYRHCIGVLVLRISPPTVDRINAFLERLLTCNSDDIEQHSKCLIIAKDQKLRIRH